MIWLLLATFFLSIVSEQTVLYVNTNGSDQNNGSLSAPFQSIGKAFESASHFDADVAILLSAGVFNSTNDCFLNVEWTANRLRFASQSGEKLFFNFIFANENQWIQFISISLFRE